MVVSEGRHKRQRQHNPTECCLAKKDLQNRHEILQAEKKASRVLAFQRKGGGVLNQAFADAHRDLKMSKLNNGSSVYKARAEK